MSKTIPQYTAANSIDAASDYLLIYNNAAAAYRKINRNVLLGVTGTPMDTSTSQNVTNKTLDNTNTVTLKDTLFTLQDDGDTTKQARFQLSGITTATIRTYTLPNASSTLVDLSSSQTLTGKTLTSPIITGGSIDNSTITVDAIGEHTAANGVSVDSLNIKDGKLNTNNSVVTANITDAAVTPAKLVTGTGAGWAWSTWSPTWTNLTVGNGTTAFGYIQTGKTVHFRIKLVFGSTSAISGNVEFTLPVSSNAAYQGAESAYVGHVKILDAGTAGYVGTVALSNGSATKATILVLNAAATYLQTTALSSTIPMTWGLSDELHITGSYEAA